MKISFCSATKRRFALSLLDPARAGLLRQTVRTFHPWLRPARQSLYSLEPPQVLDGH